MKIKKLTLSLVAMVAMSTMAFSGGDVEPVAPVVDDSGFYVGLGYSYMTFDRIRPGNGVLKSLTGNGITAIAGYQFNPYFAIEGRYSTTVGDMTRKIGGNEVDVDAELTNIGIYLKPMVSSGNLSLYGLLGYGKLTFTNSFSVERSESGFQWGLGAGYKISENFNLNLDYICYYDDTGFDGAPGDYSSDAVTLSLTYRF